MKPKKVDDLDATLYSLEVYITPLSDDALTYLERRIRYHCEKDGISGMIAVSTTDSNTAKPSVKKTGRKGRPRKVIEGIRVDRHAHTAFKGTSQKSARSTVFNIKDDMDEWAWINGYKAKRCSIVSKGSCNKIHALNYTQYSIRQGHPVHTFGDFDFRKYASQS
jgi:hypothetical protein